MAAPDSNARFQSIDSSLTDLAEKKSGKVNNKTAYHTANELATAVGSYDNTSSGLTATTVQAAIDEVQANIIATDEASEITYDNTSSGLTATDVQAAIDEVQTNINQQAEVIAMAVTDETTAITATPTQLTFRMPYAMTLSDVRASLTTAGTTSGTTTVDINLNGASIFTTNLLTIDFDEKTSTTAATAANITTTSLTDDAEITVDVDAVTTGATEAGLKIYLIGTRA
jgi:hypothetical protein